jgi:hypothetical protein
MYIFKDAKVQNKIISLSRYFHIKKTTDRTAG